MSRTAGNAGAGADTVVVKPANNIYTVLAAVACVVVILGLVAVFMRADKLFGGLTSAPPSTQMPVRGR